MAIPRRQALLLGAIVLAGALLRLHYLGEPMRWDEAYTFDTYALGSPWHIASTLGEPAGFGPADKIRG